jgi:hypothetical protein
MNNLLLDVYDFLMEQRGNTDGTVFIGEPELRDMARRLGVPLGKLRNTIVPVCKLRGRRVAAVDGEPGWEVAVHCFKG